MPHAKQVHETRSAGGNTTCRLRQDAERHRVGSQNETGAAAPTQVPHAYSPDEHHGTVWCTIQLKRSSVTSLGTRVGATCMDDADAHGLAHVLAVRCRLHSRDGTHRLCRRLRQASTTIARQKGQVQVGELTTAARLKGLVRPWDQLRRCCAAVARAGDCAEYPGDEPGGSGPVFRASYDHHATKS